MKKLWALRYVFRLLAVLGLGAAFIIYAFASFPAYAVAALALVALALAILYVWIRWREERRGWRVRCVVAGRWAYEEKREGLWAGFQFGELGDYRESPHIIGLPLQEQSADLPGWAAERRDEIIARIKSELRSPNFEFRDAPI